MLSAQSVFRCCLSRNHLVKVCSMADFIDRSLCNRGLKSLWLHFVTVLALQRYDNFVKR